MSRNPEELKQKYLSLREGIDVPFSPANLPYAHTSGSAVIAVPNYKLIRRSIRAMQKRSEQVLNQVEQSYIDLFDDQEFVETMKEAPLLDKEQLEAITLKEEKLKAKDKQLKSALKDELVNVAFAHLLNFAEVHLVLEPNILYHYYAHDEQRLVISLIAPYEKPPFRNYVGTIRREDDDKLHAIKIADMYKKKVLKSGEEKSSNI